MPASFPRPTFPFDYTVATEIRRVREHRASRGIPGRELKNLLVATWSIANFGGQDRRVQDHSADRPR